MFKIQRPKFIVLYNGAEEMKYDVMTLRLSDMFAERKSGDPPADERLIDLELTVTVYNINKGHNVELVNCCAALREYSIFIDTIREYQKIMSVEEAIQKAVADCINQDVLKDILLKHKGDVINMIYSDFNLDLAVEVAKEEGMEEGMMKKALKFAKWMKDRGHSIQDIIDATELTVDDIISKV